MFHPCFIRGLISLVPKLPLGNALAAKLRFATLAILLTLSGPFPAPAAEGDAPRYAGRTVAEWNDWFKAIDLASSAAARVAPDLVQLAADPAAPAATRRAATLTLGRLDAAAADALPLFATLLDDTAPTAIDDVPRSWALKAVALLGAPARDLTPRIVEILNAAETSPLDRLLSLEALARIGPAHAQSLGAVVAILENGHPAPSSAGPDAAAADLELRTVAAGVLSLFGKSASPAIPALLRAARSDHEPLRRAAATTLGSAGDASLIDPLADILLFDDSPAVRDAAAVSLSQLGPQTANIFTQLLTDTDSATRARAADALRRLGPAARPSLPTVAKVLTDESPEVQIAAAEAIWSISGEVPQPLDTAARLLAEPTREIRMRAHRLLVDMGRATHDPALMSRLQTLSASRDNRVRQAAYLALREILQSP